MSWPFSSNVDIPQASLRLDFTYDHSRLFPHPESCCLANGHVHGDIPVEEVSSDYCICPICQSYELPSAHELYVYSNVLL